MVVTLGNVGIGTWSPRQSLDVIGNITASGTITGATISGALSPSSLEVTGQTTLNTSSGNTGIGTTLTGGNTARLAVIGGNVGIGTITPQGAFVVTNGNVGINTWAPNTALTVHNGNVGIGTGSVSHARLEIVGNGAQELFRVNDSGLNDTSPFIINSAGYVGIGTSSPSNNLQVQVPSGAANILLLSPANTASFTLNGNSALNGQLIFQKSSVTAWTINNPSTSALQFSSTVGVAMLLSSSGNVGFGTTSPQAGLVAMGNVGIGTWTSAGGNLIVNGGGNVGIGSAWPGATLDVLGNIRASGTGSMGILLLTPTSSVQNITAGGGVSSVANSYIKIAGSGGAVVINNGVTQVAAGIDGQELVLYGTSDANTVMFHDGDGLKLSSGVSFTMGNNTCLRLIYNSTGSFWREVSRGAN